MKSQRTIIDGPDAVVADENKTQIGRGRGGKTQPEPGAHVVGDLLQAFKKIRLRQPHAADQNDDAAGDQSGC